MKRPSGARPMVLVAVTLLALGLWFGLTGTPLSGATIGGALLLAAGGALALRILHVAIKRQPYAQANTPTPARRP